MQPSGSLVSQDSKTPSASLYEVCLFTAPGYAHSLSALSANAVAGAKLYTHLQDTVESVLNSLAEVIVTESDIYTGEIQQFHGSQARGQLPQLAQVSLRCQVCQDPWALLVACVHRMLTQCPPCCWEANICFTSVDNSVRGQLQQVSCLDITAPCAFQHSVNAYCSKHAGRTAVCRTSCLSICDVSQAAPSGTTQPQSQSNSLTHTGGRAGQPRAGQVRLSLLSLQSDIFRRAPGNRQCHDYSNRCYWH